MADPTRTFFKLFGDGGPVRKFHCPGRINLIGEHIDHQGGTVMPAAISLGITAAIRLNGSDFIRAHSMTYGNTVCIACNGETHLESGHWGNYLSGVVVHLTEMGLTTIGCDVIFNSNLPPGAGLSSSAAMEVLSYYMLHNCWTGTAPDPLNMVKDCQHIENSFIGVNCGIMDQFTVTLGRKDHAILLNCRTLDHEHIPINPGPYALVIIDTKVSRELRRGEYNRRREECDEALRIVLAGRQTGHLPKAETADLGLIDDPVICKRARHVISEQKRVLAAREALKANDLVEFGRLLNRSHASLRDDFEVSCNESDLVVALAQESEACLGARMIGAGFGGCCLALVRESQIPAFETELEQGYIRRFRTSPVFHRCKISSGVQELP